MATKQSEYKGAERSAEDKAKSRANEREKSNRSDSEAKSKDAKQQKEKRLSKQNKKTARVRIFPLWLRIIIIGILSVAALMAGLMIGYGVIGDGTPLDALKVETWQHIIDIVVREE
jgi:cobalamin biosynthesis Mg chelatase CobN